MLVCSRKKNDWLDIGDNIEIVVIEIRNGQVRLGIRAPSHVSVVRREAKCKESRDRSKEARQPEAAGLDPAPAE